MVKKGLTQRVRRKSLDSVGESLVANVAGMIARTIRIIFVGIKIANYMLLEALTGKVLPYASMARTQYSPFDEINELQMSIMLFVDKWVREIKKPVPRQEIMKEFTNKKNPHHHPAITIEGALTALLYKGYIRRAYSGSNKTYYVQLRNIRV